MVRMPLQILSIGICMPITPVDARRTCCVSSPSASAAASALFAHSSSPMAPVQALATPLFMTQACALPYFCTISRSQITGEAFTRFDVNVPARVHGTSEQSIAISLRSFLIPAQMPIALNPLAEVTPPSIIFMPYLPLYVLYSVSSINTVSSVLRCACSSPTRKK